jgi:hypothetical protein
MTLFHLCWLLGNAKMAIGTWGIGRPSSGDEDDRMVTICRYCRSLWSSFVL